ncbi:MAG TPA: hypothetical protein PKE20_03900, partial [Promineifilum sp.]|nr:hypothetical protein [Promineifilum sp.]
NLLSRWAYSLLPIALLSIASCHFYATLLCLMMKGISRVTVCLVTGLTGLLLALTACDPGGRLAQLTPQAPVATPI